MNAYEGLGAPGLLICLTVMHLFGHVLPWAALLLMVIRPQGGSLALGLALAAVTCQIFQRIMLASRFRLPLLTAPLHALGVLGMVLVQWDSFRLHRSGRRAWRGRVAGASA